MCRELFGYGVMFMYIKYKYFIQYKLRMAHGLDGCKAAALAAAK